MLRQVVLVFASNLFTNANALQTDNFQNTNDIQAGQAMRIRELQLKNQQLGDTLIDRRSLESRISELERTVSDRERQIDSLTRQYDAARAEQTRLQNELDEVCFLI